MLYNSHEVIALTSAKYTGILQPSDLSQGTNILHLSQRTGYTVTVVKYSNAESVKTKANLIALNVKQKN